MKGPAEAAAATGRGGRSRGSRPGPTRRRLTSQWERGGRGPAQRGRRSARVGENEARVPALRSPVPPAPSRSATSASAALPSPSPSGPHSSRARGKLLLSPSRAGPAARRLSPGMRTVGLAARRLRLCGAAVKPTFPPSRCCRASRNLVRADHGGFAARKQSPWTASLPLLLRRRGSAGP